MVCLTDPVQGRKMTAIKLWRRPFSAQLYIITSCLLCFGDDTAVTVLPGAALQRLGFIQNHVLPLHPLEVLHILHNQLVARDHHVEWRILGVQGFLCNRRQARVDTASNNTVTHIVTTLCPQSLGLSHLAPEFPDHLAIMRIPPVWQHLTDTADEMEKRETGK